MPSSNEPARDEIDSLFHLSLSLHHLNRDIERKFKLSLVQLFVLLRLRHMPATCSKVLAAAVGIHPSTLTQTLRRLERKEYIFVAADPRDSRRKLISLTRSGCQAIEIGYRDLKGVLGSIGRDAPHSLENSLLHLTLVRKRMAEV